MGKTKVEGKEIKLELEAFVKTRSKHRRAKKKVSVKAARERKSPGDPAPPDDPDSPAT